MRTLVIQSHRPVLRQTWVGACLDSVAGWSELKGYDYRFFGDEALDNVPDWYRRKAAGRLPVVADLARLLLIREALADGYRRVCWLDADVLVFAPRDLCIDTQNGCAFGRECWVQPGRRGGRLEVHRNVHNALCVFEAGSPVLEFLIHATERIVARVHPERIAPQLVGPKLLTALHNIVGFELVEAVGALSPPVLDDLERGTGPALELLRASQSAPLAAANLCASLAGERDLTGVCERLLAAGALPG